MVILGVAILGCAAYVLYRSKRPERQISEFGRYEGYSASRYDGTDRMSAYLTLANGRKLAYDLLLPTKRGAPALGPLPVLFKYTPYLRTFTIFDDNGKNIIAPLFHLGWKERSWLRVRSWLSDRGRLMDPLFRTKWLKSLSEHGYAVIVVERPGTGASFGRAEPGFDAVAREADEILNWIAAQPWCDGNIGMFGNSWEGHTQLAAASTANPHLKAILPVATWFDSYSAVTYSGGVYNKAFGRFFFWSLGVLQTDVITPVDQDRDRALLNAARRERRGATAADQSPEDFFKSYPLRDSKTPDGHQFWTEYMAVYPFMDRINRSGIPVYLVGGWYDLFARDVTLLYANLSVPKRLLIRPLDHSQIDERQFDLDFGAEVRRWFDYWLKGVPNGIMDEAPVHYYVMQAPRQKTWHAAQTWPPERDQPMTLYLRSVTTGGTTPSNRGLTTEEPSASDTFDAHTVDYATTTGARSRWTAVNWPRRYADMRDHDARAMAYTTAPLASDVITIGHPVVRLWLTKDTVDLDTFVYLEDVDEAGKSTYVTEGNLRASHRRVGRAPYLNLGLPYHPHDSGSLVRRPNGQPFELAFDLLPTAYQFRKGNRIRVTVAFADADNFETPILAPAPSLHLLSDLEHPSLVRLPARPALLH